MITCYLMGGLGNQIFQIFATISYAIKSNNSFNFTNKKILGGDNTTIRYTYWNTFFSQLKSFTIDNFPKMQIIRENDFAFNELPIKEMINNDIMIYGYFQSYKYFETHYDTICRLIGLELMRENVLNKLTKKINNFEDIISMHFRIGDYKYLQHVHPIMSLAYYKNCLNYIKQMYPDKSFNIMYFYEDEDLRDVLNIINELSQVFPLYTFVRGDNTLVDWEQMLLMSCCHHNIIANSSFSWWGAYFNEWADKIVCYPSVWFGSNIGHNTVDLCPNNWVKINTE